MMSGGIIEQPKSSPAVISMRLEFLEKTGYGINDLLALNVGTRTLMTRNGGIYRLPVSGEIEHIKGPSPDPEERL